MADLALSETPEVAEENNLESNAENSDNDQLANGTVESTADESGTEKGKKKKVNKKKLKKKMKKRAKQSVTSQLSGLEIKEEDDDEKVDIIYVRPNDLQHVDSSMQEEFAKIFSKFATPEELTGVKKEETTEEGKESGSKDANASTTGVSGADEASDKPADQQLSKRKKKLLRRLTVAQLKQLVDKPDVVEAHDVTAADPRMLVFLKSYRNTVPVPRHWCQKRKYLQGKRGIEKIPFKLPDFIAATGIEKIRQAYAEKEGDKKAKQKMREKMMPKMGRQSIDYQILEDAFFKYQTKPKMTMHGDMYYEGKEFEVKVKGKRPGELTEELKKALGMPENAPPPWLINMQRYGPPPSYTNLKIPGLNAPIPEGASFGYHPGGWGKPPVDEFGRPLYGDVFGTQLAEEKSIEAAEHIDRTKHWGDLEPDEEEEEEEEEQPEMPEEEEEEGAGLTTEEVERGIETSTSMASGMTSVPTTGLETPEIMELRKRREPSGVQAVPLPTTEKPLFQVLTQKEVSVGAGLMGSSYVYQLPDKNQQQAALEAAQLQATTSGSAAPKSGVVVSLDETQLASLDKAQLSQIYEKEMAAKGAENRPEDFSEMVSEHAAKKKRKSESKETSKAKKQKDFKF